MSYQGYGQGADRGLIAELTRLIGLEPHLTLVLDVSETVAVSRLVQRGAEADRYEELGTLFHARVNQGFRDIAAAAAERCVLIPADGTAERVQAAIMRAVRSRLLGNTP